MISNKLISINVVISKIVRDLGLTDQIPYQDFIEWIAEAMQFIGSYEQYDVKTCTITVTDYEGILPCDFYKPTYNISGLKYRITFGKILSELQECEVEIQYLAMPTDCDGYPLIPDDESYKTACFWYVAKMLALRSQLPAGLQLGTKTLSNYAYCQSRWDRYCGQARAQANMFGVDETQKSVEQRNKLIPDQDQYYKLFIDLGKRQILNRDIR